MREIKFRVAHIHSTTGMFSHFSYWGRIDHKGEKSTQVFASPSQCNYTTAKEDQQYTGLKDKNGKEIYEGDILEFTDKWEWYKGKYGIKMHFANENRRAELKKEYDAEPMERRIIELPEYYEFLLSGEIQQYWAVIGNIYENPELLTSK